MPSAFLHPFAPPAKEHFTAIVRGEGALVFDDQGNSYIDGMGSLWYSNIGHGRAEMADAIAAQVRTLEAFSCFDPFTNPPAEALATRIAALAPMPEARVFLTSSGSEAVDSAIKLARIAMVQAGHPERQVIISRERGYHGVTYGGLSVQGLPANQAGFGPLLPGIINLPSDDLDAVASVLAERGPEVAAIITEPLQGAAGVYPPVDGYLQGLERLARQHGCFLIADEVITGFGRLGRWFGSQHYGIEPDLITFAKGVSSGYLPIGGVIAGRRVTGPLEADPAFMLRHGFTYSGHPTAAVAAVTNIDIIEREDLLARAVHIGERLGNGLRSLQSDGLVADVRGAGAVFGVGLNDGDSNIGVRNAMMAAGVITRAIPPSSVTFCPPLVITDAQIDQIVDALAGAVGKGK
jgi:putrescine aminotransferase